MPYGALARAVIDVVCERRELDDQYHLRAGVVQLVAAIIGDLAVDMAQAQVTQRHSKDQLGRQRARHQASRGRNSPRQALIQLAGREDGVTKPTRQRTGR